jgi:2-C-methyl-D-erythritol 2,4-cyclodiphosphate synthase
MRVGLGYDAHRLAPGRPLILGGVAIPYHLGLLGHSDADVLSHAVGDALLGAVGAGDLGVHFPDQDPAYQGISSLILLVKIVEIALDRGFRPVNVDATVVAQAPRLAPHIPEMVANLAATLGLPPDAVNVKATTTEHLGFTGRGEGMAAYAVVLVEKVEAPGW